ncbi:MAG: hypothetical protein IIZ35_02055, partial [Clostridia bacterium]|nr:hypothetical protein [Clostridia bacterium]
RQYMENVERLCADRVKSSQIRDEASKEEAGKIIEKAKNYAEKILAEAIRLGEKIIKEAKSRSED